MTVELKGYSPVKHNDLEVKYVLKTPFREQDITKNAKVQKNGKFNLELDYAFPYQQIFLIVDERIYFELIVNQALHVVIDLNKRSKSPFSDGRVQFSGPDAELNQYLNQYNVYQLKNLRKEKRTESFGDLLFNNELNFEEKLTKLKAIYKKGKEDIDAFIKETPSAFSWKLLNDYHSDFYGVVLLLHQGTNIKSELLQKALDHKPLLTSGSAIIYFSYLTMYMTPTREEQKQISIDLMTKEIENEVERNKMVEHLDSLFSLPNQTAAYFSPPDSSMIISPEASMKADFEFQAKKIGQLPKYRASLCLLLAEPQDLLFRRIFLEASIPQVQAKWCKKLMQDQLDADLAETARINSMLEDAVVANEQTEIGEKIMQIDEDINLYTAHHENIESLLKSIRNHYQGKAIILDIWTTWCGICISDMKECKVTQIKQELAKLPVALVYLCSSNGGSTMEKWKKKLVEIQPKGDHIYLNPELSKEIMTHFQLTGFPSYIFIDQKGKIDKDFIFSIAYLNTRRLKRKL